MSFAALALFVPVVALAGQTLAPKPDDGVRPGFHQKNAGKIVFSTVPITPGKEDPGKLVTSFKLGQPIYWRVYSERSAANQARGDGHECRFDEAPPARSFLVELDGKALTGTFPTFAGTKVSKKEWNSETSWSESHALNAPVDTHEISFNADFVARVVGDLSPGTHKLVMKAVAECVGEKPRYISKPMAVGSITIEVSPEAVAAVTAPQADLPAAGRKDPKLAAQAIKIMNAYWKQHGSDRRAVKAVIVDKDWSLERNELTGIVIARSIDTVVAYKDDKGCHFYSVRLRQDASGQRGFGDSYLGSEGAAEEDIACTKVK
jgi:hypothetical protein